MSAKINYESYAISSNDGQIVSYSKSIADETGESPDEVYTKLRNYYFITIFTRKIRAYFISNFSKNIFLTENRKG